MLDRKRRWKSLSLKVEHLRLELEDREDIIREFEKSFFEELSKVELEEDGEQQHKETAEEKVSSIDIRDENVDFSCPEDAEEIHPQNVEEKPEEIKKVWRAIAACTHPDKTGNDFEKTQLYKKALSALNSGSYDEIYKIASQLGIDIPEASDHSISSLENISKSLEEKIKNTESSVLWVWGKTDPAKRQGIIDIYLHSKGKKRKKKQQ